MEPNTNNIPSQEPITNLTPKSPMNPNKKGLMIAGLATLIVLVVVALVVFRPSSSVDPKYASKVQKWEQKQAMKNGTSGSSLDEDSTTTGSTTVAPAGTGTANNNPNPVAGSVSQSEDYSVTTIKDVTYGSGSGLTLKVDIYKPTGVPSATPAVMFIHGGGFHGGSKNGVADESLMLAKHGTAVVAVDYRLSGTAIFPSPLYDVKGAVRFVKAHASEYNIDPNAIFVLGESAGGALGNLLGVTEGNASLEGNIGGNLSYTSDVAGIIDISGSYVASIVDTMSSGIKHAIENETGCEPVPSTACESTYEALSVETYITSNDSPFIILHGGKDTSVPQIQAETLDSKLRAAGVSSELHIAPDLGHVGGLLERFMSSVVSFINANS